MSEALDLIAQLLRVEAAKDSLEIGTPAKGGAIKIYTDFSDVEGTKEKIRRAVEARTFASELLGGPAP